MSRCIDPLIVSNGAKDGLVMPAHLAALAQRIPRGRANIVEMRDVLARWAGSRDEAQRVGSASLLADPA